MKKLSAAAYNEVRTWIYRNARPLELALWQFDFENGSPELSLIHIFQIQKIVKAHRGLDPGPHGIGFLCLHIGRPVSYTHLDVYKRQQ